MIRKIFHYFNYMGLYAFKVLFYSIIKKTTGINNIKIKTKIKNKKTGNYPLTIRPFTTDLKLVKKLLINNGEYDFIYNSKYKDLRKSKIIIDAGANIGIFSRIINEICKDALIIAIEPENQNYKLLKSNLNSKQFICKQNGLWNKNSKLIVKDSKTGEWGFTVEETNGNKYDILGISIPDIMKEYNIDRINILKIDIEGSEYEVFDNSCNKWINKVDMIIIEFHDRKKKRCSLRVMEKMKSHNFDFEIYGENYVFYKHK